MGPKLDAVTAEMQHQAVLGIVLPSSLLEKSITIIDGTVQPSPVQNGLVTSFVSRMDDVKSLDAKRKSQLQSEAVSAVKDQVYPAYARMRDALIALRPAAAKQSAGVNRLPDGTAFYNLMLRQQTTSNYTAEQLHALGLSEVARITREMQAILDAQGYEARHRSPRVSSSCRRIRSITCLTPPRDARSF